jgi:hypothetical protein
MLTKYVIREFYVYNPPWKSQRLVEHNLGVTGLCYCDVHLTLGRNLCHGPEFMCNDDY